MRSALHRAEQALLGLIAARVDAATVERLEALIVVSDDDDDGEDVLALIKAAPGNVSLDTMLTEIAKLEAIRAIGLPSDVFADVAPTVVAGWRARAMVESPSHLREHPQPTKLALLCALLVLREREVTDTLAQLLISTIHRINAHAEQKVVAEFVKDFRRVRGKDTMLRKIAEASLKTPDDSVREVIYPVVGGEATLTDLVNEYRATGMEYQRQKRKVFKASYTNHYRRSLIRLLGVLEFRSNNTAHQPVIDALGLIVRYAHHGGTYYPLGEHVVLEGAVSADWTELLTKTDSRGRDRVVRGVYEACVFQALRERLRCKEIWVVGAHEWRNPDEDLPTDFEVHRAEHYDRLREPLDPEGVHGRAAGGDAHRTRRAQRRATGPAVAADHQPQERRDPAHRPRSPARTAQPTAPEESCAGPLGAGPVDRHGHRSRPADGDARRADRRRLTRSAATLRTVGAPVARGIEEGLNVIESWNRVNGVIFFGKSGEFATNRRDQQQLGMLALHILQAALVYVNTLMLQDILAEPEWQGVLTAEDQRGLTALFWAHVRPYGEITLNMTKRLALSAGHSSELDRESA